MPLVRDINVTVRNETSAVATFEQLYEGYWEWAELEFARVRGTRTWRPVVPKHADILHEAKTAVTRLMNERHAATVIPRRLRRSLSDYRPQLPRINAPAGVVVRGAGAPPVTPVKTPGTPVRLVRESVVPASCACDSHTNTWVRGSGKWRSHALSFGCVGS